MLVMDMEQIKATRGRQNPGVRKKLRAETKKGGSAVSPFSTFSISDVEGGMGGLFLNWSKVPRETTVHKTAINKK
eukprot:scaffold31340_cov53-Attheya_sp.AAC.5